MARRSVLFSPGDERDKLVGACDSAADVVVFDLEDGVAPADRGTARSVIGDVLADDPGRDGPAELVRINPLESGGTDDVEALGAADVTAAIDGIVVPKVDSTAAVSGVVEALADAGLPTTTWCLIETATAMFEARAIAEHDAVTALIFGGEDYAANVGADRTEAGTELLVPRQQVVMAAAAGGVDAIDGVSTTLTDRERVHRDALEAATFGFDGKLAIHPAQLEPINEAFTPTQERIDWATRVVEAADNAEGGAIRVDDEMIDAPLIRRAERILRDAGRRE